jgi:hypothetical protein
MFAILVCPTAQEAERLLLQYRHDELVRLCMRDGRDQIIQKYKVRESERERLDRDFTESFRAYTVSWSKGWFEVSLSCSIHLYISLLLFKNQFLHSY